MENKDFKEIEEYAAKRALESVDPNNIAGINLINTIARVCALSIAEYHRKTIEDQKKND